MKKLCDKPDKLDGYPTIDKADLEPLDTSYSEEGEASNSSGTVDDQSIFANRRRDE